MRGRRVRALGCTRAAVVAVAGSASAATVLVVTGRGWGHGVGMSQWGAEGYARHGATWQRILAHYYPGTKLAPSPISRIRVLLAAGQPQVGIARPAAVKVFDGTGNARPLAAGAYQFGPRLRLPVGHKKLLTKAAHQHA